MGKKCKPAEINGHFTYVQPATLLQKNHNKEALAILETKRSQMILDVQAIGTAYIPQHKIKTNFLDYYQNYVKENRSAGNRHLETSLSAFKSYLRKDFISATDISENLCKAFRDYLLKRYNGGNASQLLYAFQKSAKGSQKGWLLQGKSGGRYPC
jgi:hypothetical protein